MIYEPKFRRSYPFGKERFQGLAVTYKPDGCKITVVADQTRGNKADAMTDAQALADGLNT